MTRCVIFTLKEKKTKIRNELFTNIFKDQMKLKPYNKTTDTINTNLDLETCIRSSQTVQYKTELSAILFIFKYCISV